MNPSGQLIGWHDIAELTQQFGRDRNIVTVGRIYEYTP
jgi:hypothetical protein